MEQKRVMVRLRESGGKSNFASQLSTGQLSVTHTSQNISEPFFMYKWGYMLPSIT